MIRSLLLAATLFAVTSVQAKNHKNIVTHKVKTKDLFTIHTRNGSHSACQTGCVVPTPEIPPGQDMVQNPDSPAVAFYPNANAQNNKVEPDQTLDFSFFAASPHINDQQIGTPPDTMGAIGPEQYIVAINNGLISYNKHTGEQDWVLNVGPGTFGSGDANLLTENRQDAFDPRIRYDTFSERWFIAYDLRSLASEVDNGFYLAVSEDKVITDCTNWKVLFIPNATIIPDENGCSGDLGTFLDYPMIGIDKHAVYISAVMFPVSTSPTFPGYCNVYVIPKKYLLSEGAPVVTAFRNIYGVVEHLASINPFRFVTVQAVDNFDPDPEFGYFIGTVPYTFGSLGLFRVEKPWSKNPSLIGPMLLTVPTTATDYRGVPHAGNLYGNSGTLEQIDDRPLMAHVRDGQLYTAQGVKVTEDGVALFDESTQFAVGDRNAVRWYQIDVSGSATSTPTLVQAGTLFDDQETDTPLHYIYGAIMTNKHDELVISGTLSGETTYPKAFFVGRKKHDPLGILKVGADQEGVVFADSFGVFTRSLNTRGVPIGHQRWGDYSYISLDPCDEKTMWSIQEVYEGSLETLWVAKIGSSH